MNRPQKSLLDDFSKDALVKFIIKRIYFREIEEVLRDLRYIEWETLSKKAAKAMDAAISSAKNEDTSTIEGRARWMKAQDDFDKAQKMYDKADEIYRQIKS